MPMQRPADPTNCATSNETITGADVGKRHPRLKIGPVEYPVRICFDLNSQRGCKNRIAAVGPRIAQSMQGKRFGVPELIQVQAQDQATSCIMAPDLPSKNPESGHVGISLQ